MEQDGNEEQNIHDNKHQKQINVIKETEDIINKNNEINNLIQKEAEKELLRRKEKKKNSKTNK